ncbi:DUF4239 domain-containing protein [Rhizobium leguminosarum]|uniref:DUF4239 domain-containing protein n=1 Tax=Rhizobium leguminosarum TaxID=384 RepID=A0A2Z4YSK5_RHILE|nr:DUF4239 domain-containing protein [Rhizobium leguminosarum]AXA44271.1 hypothetical protein DLJ82_6300 [Rhizobium leguminosarum]
MSFDAFIIVALFFGTIFVVMISIEGGYLLGCFAHRRSTTEKESPVSSIAAAVLALLSFILAFTFSVASNHFDARKELVQEEANKIRTVWQRSDFLPDPERAETKALIRGYLVERTSAVRSTDPETLKSVFAQAEQTQSRLWEIAVANARKDLNSDIGGLFVEALNDMFAVHASRVTVGFQKRIPGGIWLALITLTILGMMAMGYVVGIAGSKRTLTMPLLALSFASVVAAIGVLDRPIGGLTNVSQQPLIDLLSSIAMTSAPKQIGIE